MYKLFWEAKNTSNVFSVFSTEHILGLIFVGLLLFSIIKCKEVLKKNDQKIRFLMAFIMFLQQFSLYAWYMSSGVFTLKESLPLYTCRIAIILMIIMLIKPRQWIFDIAYFWGMVGAIIALITPDTSSFSFPHLMFVQYFIGHGFLLASIVYMLVIKSYYITSISLIRAFKVSLAYIVFIIPLNFLLDANYSYMNFKPATKTLLDIFPPFPAYVPIIISLVFALFLLAYWPFYILEKREIDFGKIFK